MKIRKTAVMTMETVRCVVLVVGAIVAIAETDMVFAVEEIEVRVEIRVEIEIEIVEEIETKAIVTGAMIVMIVIAVNIETETAVVVKTTRRGTTVKEEEGAVVPIAIIRLMRTTALRMRTNKTRSLYYAHK